MAVNHLSNIFKSTCKAEIIKQIIKLRAVDRYRIAGIAICKAYKNSIFKSAIKESLTISTYRCYYNSNISE